MTLRQLALSFLAFFAAVAATTATELTDLGERLAYLRVHSVGESAKAIASNVTADHALVLDLRYATTAPEDASVMRDALARRSSRSPLLILVSPATPEALQPALATLPRGTVTLGVADSKPAPQVVVMQPAEVDRRAYDALDGGMKLEDLVTGKIEKERFDEASLVKEFQNGNAIAAPPPTPDPARVTPEKAPVLTDRVLQRAIHLHRALAALQPRDA
ncbi:MAG: hypothetical protein C0518_00180 [Opitutus sp.]|nr:hypothetical protein [Opitutus sp.]